MDIAAAGYVLPLPGPLQDRPQPRFDNAGRARGESTRDTGRSEISTNPSRGNERVVDGEGIYERPEASRTAAQGALSSSTNGFSFQEPRRFSIPAAIQAFRENEALLTRPGELRQVSGIID